MSAKAREFTRWLLGVSLIVGVMAGGGFYAAALRQRITKESMLKVMLNQATAFAGALSLEDLRELSFSSADVTNRAFLRIQKHLRNYASLFDDENVSVIGLRDGQFFFGPETLADNHPIASPSGTLYLHPSKEILRSALTRTPGMDSSVEDEYGVFSDAYAPIVDPETDKVIAEVLVFQPVEHWQALSSRVGKSTWLAVSFLAFVLLVGFTLCCLRPPFSSTAQRRLVHAESLTILVAGTFFTCALLVAYRNDTRIQERAIFSNTAFLHANHYYALVQAKCKSVQRTLRFSDKFITGTILPYKDIADKASSPEFVKGFLNRLLLDRSESKQLREDTDAAGILGQSFFFPLFIEDKTYVMAFTPAKNDNWFLSAGSPLFSFGIMGIAFTLLLVLGVELFRRYRDRLVTKLTQQTNALGENSKQYHLLAENSVAVIWSFDYVNNRFISVSPQIKDLLGYSVSDWENSPKEMFMRSVYPEDKEKVSTMDSAHIPAGDTYVAGPFRMYRKNGTIAWVREVISVNLKDGKPAKIDGVLFDITDEMNAPQRNRRVIKLLACLRDVNHLSLRQGEFSAPLRAMLESFTAAAELTYCAIALMDESGKVTGVIHSSKENNSSAKSMIDLLQRNELTACFRAAYTSSTFVRVFGPSPICKRCFFSESGVDRSPEKMLISLQNGTRIYGVLFAKNALNATSDEIMRGIFEEFAKGITMAIAEAKPAKGI